MSEKHSEHDPRPSEAVRPMYARARLLGPAPRHAIPAEGMAPSTAYSLIHDELIVDGSSRFNLATFCSTWMEPEAHKLMAETFDKNMIDKDEYPQTAELEMRCVHMLADLWHAPDPEATIGLLDHRLQRSLHAGRPGAEVALARTDAQAGKARRDRPQPGDGHEHAGLLAQVRALLGCGGARRCRSKATRWSPIPSARRRRATRTPSAWSSYSGQHVHRRTTKMSPH